MKIEDLYVVVVESNIVGDSFELAVEIVVIVVLVNDANVLNAVDEDIGVVVSIEDMIVDQVEVNNVGDWIKVDVDIGVELCSCSIVDNEDGINVGTSEENGIELVGYIVESCGMKVGTSEERPGVDGWIETERNIIK